MGFSSSLTRAALLLGHAAAITLPSGYDTIWATQSQNSAGSMPAGGGDLGLNVWVENNHLLMYMQQSGAFDENNSLLKLGRLNISMDPNPLDSAKFKQHLHINDGYITITGANNTVITIWTDMETSTVHIDSTSDEPINYTAAIESWRTSGYTMPCPEQQQTSWGVICVSAIPNPYQYPDTVQFTQGGVLSYHHNTKQPLFNAQVVQQGLQNPSTYFNPMQNNTFGLFMYSPQLQLVEPKTKGNYISTSYVGFPMSSRNATRSLQLVIGTNQQQTTNVKGWKKKLIASTKSSINQTQDSTIAFWNAYWDRSWIIINPTKGNSDLGFQVGKNYQYFRYMMACNANGEFPLRFNGGLFNFDPALVEGGVPYTPDYRKWSGGTFTAQNQRLLYWPQLAMGDVDIMHQEFNFYQNISPNSRKLGQLYFNLDVMLTSEQIDNTGLPNIYEYDANEYSDGQNRTAIYPPGIDFNDYLSWLQDTANEFADMVIMANSYFGTNVQQWVTFVEYQLAWFDEFYQQRNGLTPDGKLLLYPASGCETFKLATNPASTVSGLYRTITDLLSSNITTVKGNTSYYEAYRSRVPPTPLQQCPGATSLTCIAPAVNYSFTENTELVNMYPVFPWGEYGLGQPTNLTYALNAYFNDSVTSSWRANPPIGWNQDQIWWARMGLVDLATNNTIYRLRDSDVYRFSAFLGPDYDWSPDINAYGSATLGLQNMLMQTFALNNTQIRLLGAWPSDWTGEFKLYAPQQTTVSGQITGKSIKGLSVTPSSRMKDVVYGLQKSQKPGQDWDYTTPR